MPTKKKYQVIAAVTTYCYLDVEACSVAEAKKDVNDKLRIGEIEGGDFYTMDDEEYPGSFKIINAILKQ